MSDAGAVSRVRAVDLPVRLGYFLEREGVAAAAFPAVRYRGIDRLPYLPTDEELQALRRAGRERLVALWERYLHAEDEGTPYTDRALALDFRRAFRREGVELEVVYGEVTAVPENLETYPGGTPWARTLLSALQGMHNRNAHFARRPQGLDFLGYDISHPVPTFHSAIYQPGLHRVQPDLPRYLNRHGLFGDLATALRFLHAANAMDYGALPFCVLQVWSVTA